MRTETYVTIIKHEIKDRQTSYKYLGTYPAHFEETRGVNTNRTSRSRDDIDSVTCYIPKILDEIEVEDILILNKHREYIEQFTTAKQFLQNYKAYIITSADIYDFGSDNMKHTRIGAK